MNKDIHSVPGGKWIFVVRASSLPRPMQAGSPRHKNISVLFDKKRIAFAQ
jgi:hypothetical protein